MPESECDVRRIAWSQAFPFVRLFQTARLALGFNRLALALAAVLTIYIAGRILDGLWSAAGVDHGTRDAGVVSAVQIYATSSQGDYNRWLQAARDDRAELAERVLIAAGRKPTATMPANLDAAVREAREDADFAKELDQLHVLVAERVNAGVAAAATAAERDAVRGAGDAVRAMLAGTLRRTPEALAAAPRVIERLVATEADLNARSDLQARLTRASARVTQHQLYEQTAPRGPFITLLDFETHCFAAAIQGAFRGRWGFGHDGFDPEPALAGSIVTALRGAAWVVIHRPLFTLIFGLVALAILALFGGAICRSAAVQTARDETLSIGESLGYVRQRYVDFILPPLMPVIGVLLIWVVMWIGGLLGLIPWLGELVTSVLYFLGLLGGFVAAILGLALLLGFHLMWPTVAVEGGGGFDALSRAASYIGSRIWHVLFYTFVLLLYGAAAFVLVRLVALLTLKLAHMFTGSAMNLVSGGELDSVGKLNAMWSMPPWADLTLLPSTSTPFWGWFYNGPLTGMEWFSTFFFALWVFLLVGLVAAFVLSFFFCGSTQMYFLLRRDVDATDWDEIYYEEPAEEPGPLPAGATESVAPGAADAPPTA